MIRDARNLEKALIELGSRSGGNVLVRSLNDAAKPIKVSAKQNIRTKTGESKKHIRTKGIKGKGKRSDVASVLIGGIYPDAFRLRFIEFGTKAHDIPSKTTGRGNSKRRNTAKVAFGGKVYNRVRHKGAKAQPFLKPAFNAKYKESQRIFAQRLYERIIVETIKKYGR